MSLLSNSLFLDSEYKADCEYKINYLLFTDSISNNEIENEKPIEGSINEANRFDITIDQLSSRVKEGDLPVFDGTIFHTTKKISDNYSKIIIETGNIPKIGN